MDAAVALGVWVGFVACMGAGGSLMYTAGRRRGKAEGRAEFSGELDRALKREKRVTESRDRLRRMLRPEHDEVQLVMQYRGAAEVMRINPSAFYWATNGGEALLMLQVAEAFDRIAKLVEEES